MPKRRSRIDPRVEIGHVHLKVADLDRALAFYEGVLGFEITQRIGHSAVFLSAGGYHHHIALNTWESGGGAPPLPGTTGLYHFAIRYPNRAALADALRRVGAAKLALEGASDHGVSEALYLRDPDGNGVELYCDRPREAWPRDADGSLRLVTEPLDLESLRAVVVEDHTIAQPEEGPEQATPLSDATRTRLRDMRARLLNLHKVLLEDAKAAYEMDRGRVGSSASLLQLVINDPWFAWLHALSELVVRIDETLQSDAPALEADGLALLEQVTRLISPDRAPDEFARRYSEALQRQPAVIVAHAEVRRILKQTKGPVDPSTSSGSS
jgi:catechol 2,3-dioxygenase